MSRIIRSTIVAIALLSTAACDAATLPARPDAASPQSTEKPKNKAVPASTVPKRIDPPPSDVAHPEVVERSDVQVNGEPACGFTVRYKGAVDQPVTWNKETCAALTTRFLSFDALGRLGKLDRLPPDTLSDLKASKQPVFYVEGEFTASIYPLNSAGRVYEVPVAD